MTGVEDVVSSRLNVCICSFFQMTSKAEAQQKQFSQVLAATKAIFDYDPQVVFSDTFDRLSQQLSLMENLMLQTNSEPKDYWIVYNMVISVLPIAERLIFAGYSDQILQFLLSMNNIVSSNLLFCTSRFIPFRVQVFSTVCSAMANTEEPRQKDAEALIKYFRGELTNMKELEENNVNGLTETITCCNNKKMVLSELYQNAFMLLDLMAAHFTISNEIEFDRVGGASSRKGAPKKGKQKGAKEEPQPVVMPVPSLLTVQLVINSFNSPLSKADYVSKYGQICQAWTNPDCQLAPALLYRLLFSFMKSGKLEGTDQLLSVWPDDQIVKLANALSKEEWLEASNIMAEIPKEQISIDFQFFNEIALKIWKRFTAGQISDPLVLSGVLHVLCVSPCPCPMDTCLVALEYCWHLESLERYQDGAMAAERAIAAVETFRDLFAVRKLQATISSSTSIPDKALDQNYLLFEKWMECLSVDLYTIWIKCTLKYNLQLDLQKAEVKFQEKLENTEKQKQHEKNMYGKLDHRQMKKFDALLNKEYVPPTHAKDQEEILLERFKSNCCVRALIYIQMAFFRPKQAATLLAKAIEALKEHKGLALTVGSPVLYVGRSEVALLFRSTTPAAKTAAVYGKETVGATGITMSNTSLPGTGVKRDLIEPFVVSKLKPHTLYTFAFGAFDGHGELIDQLQEPFSVATCHTMSVDLIWSYIASAAFHLKAYDSFDPAVSYLIQRFAEVKEVTAEHNFMTNTNPFNRFVMKPSTFSEPAPVLRAFSSALVMAARIFASRPLHATAFHKLAIVLSRVLSNQTLTLTICQEMFAILGPLLANKFQSKWAIQPLLYVLAALKENKETMNLPLHQELIAKVSATLDHIFVSYHQERPLCQYVVSSVLETTPNEYRSAFLLQSAKQQVLDGPTGDATLPVAAADIFRNAPERGYDDLFNKFKADPSFPEMAVYMVSCAHNVGLVNQGATWSAQALEHIKSLVAEPEEKNNKKNAAKGKTSVLKKTVKGKGASKNEQPEAEPDESEIAAGNKIHAVWRRYAKRSKNLEKHAAVVQYRAALNLLSGMCLIEVEANTAAGLPGTDKNAKKGAKPKPKNPKDKNAPVDEEAAQAEQALVAVTALKRAIVFADRAGDQETIKSAANLMYVYLSSSPKDSPLRAAFAGQAYAITDVLVSCLPVQEIWAQKLLQTCLLIMLGNDNLSGVLDLLVKATKKSVSCGDLLWMTTEANEIPEALKAVQEEIQNRDLAENVYYNADGILRRAAKATAEMFPSEPASTDDDALLRSVGELAVSLQHKQRLSMSTSLLTRLAFTLFERNRKELAVQKLCEALECHFRVVKVHERVDQVLENETEEGFYKKHSWAGCLSIFVISALISKYTPRNTSLMLAKLGGFALSSLFSASTANPKKAIDFAEFEPSEIVPGVEIFSESDPNQPLLEPPGAEYVTLAFVQLLSVLMSYDMHFEMFKPLAVAKHYFRFIVREKKGLCRARLQTVLACCHFGLLEPAIRIMNNVIANYGESRATKESFPFANPKKQLEFDASAPPTYAANTECMTTLTSAALITQIGQMYGTTLSYQFAICSSRICSVFAESRDPTGASESAQTPTKGRDDSSSKKVVRRPHHGKGKDDDPFAGGQISGSAAEATDTLLKMANKLISDLLAKEIAPELGEIKLELMLEKADNFVRQWRWQSAIQTATEILKELKARNDTAELSASYTDRALITPIGMSTASSSIIAKCSYNLSDFTVADEYGSPYYKALLMMRKSDFDGAVQMLSMMTARKPVTRFHIDYVLAVGQLVTLCCVNRKFVEVWHAKTGQTTQLDEFLRQVIGETMSFFVEELGMQETRSYYLRNTFLLVRLKHLESVVKLTLGATTDIISDSLHCLEDAENLMKNWCPYVSHSLAFYLNISSLRLQMKKFLVNSPNIIHFWNRELNVIVPINYDAVDKMMSLLLSTIDQAPDLMIYPAAQQSVMDLVFLSGIAQIESAQRLEKSCAALRLAHSVRSSRRILQALIAKCPDTPPLNSPVILLNDNPDESLRSIAAIYYAHACSLDLPLFDTELLDMRSYLFFKCFEEHLDAFKLTGKESVVEPGSVVGQWYEMSAKPVAKKSIQDNSTIVTRSTRASVFSSATSKFSMGSGKTNASQSRASPSAARGRTFFFLGLVSEHEVEEQKKKPPAKGAVATPVATSSDKLIPIVIAGNYNDLKQISDEFAAIGIDVEDANRMDGIDSEAANLGNTKDSSRDPAKAKKKPAGKGKGADEGEPTPLHNQAEIQKKQAELTWTVTVNKFETLMDKSNKILAELVASTTGIQRWPASTKVTHLEFNSAFLLSRLTNPESGISERAPQLAEWLASITVQSSPNPTGLEDSAAEKPTTPA